MPEDYEIGEDQDQGAGVAHYLDVARRRAVYFLVPLLFGFLAVWGSSWLFKPRYKSTTVILVEQPSMPTNYVLPNVSNDLQAQLASITQQIMSRTRLLMIIQKLNLYPGAHSALNSDQRVTQMSRDIDVELVHSSEGAGPITGFSVSYSAGNPHVAQRVTQELSNLFITENLEERQRESQDTTNFLEQQLQAASQNLAQQEAKVQQFEAAHEGALPTQQQSNLQILGGLQSQLQNDQEALNNAIQQRAYFQSLIEQYREFRGTTKTVDGVPVNITSLDQLLEKERAQLADLRSRYTDSYPDVQQLMAQIAQTEKTRNQMLAEAHSARAANPNPAGGAPVADPTQNSPLVQLQGQLQANQLEITNREQAIAQLKARIADYQGRLGAEPGTQAELDDLTRGYEQSQANYNDLLKKRDESAMATSMEQMQRGERYLVLDPASLPVKPDFPNRLKFCILGLAAGMGLGLLTAGVAEFLDDRLYRDQEIKDLLPVNVISEVPEIVTDADEKLLRRRLYLKWGLAVVVLVTIAASSFLSLHS